MIAHDCMVPALADQFTPLLPVCRFTPLLSLLPFRYALKRKSGSLLADDIVVTVFALIEV